MWQSYKLVGNGGESSNGAKFNLNTNGLRPAVWTSGDAAGLPTFPALVRFDERERGAVEHAIRIVVAGSRKGIHLSRDALPSTLTGHKLPRHGSGRV